MSHTEQRAEPMMDRVCPSVEEWETCLACADLNARDHRPMFDHLEECRACRDTLQWIAGDARWWTDAHETLVNQDLIEALGSLTQSICALSAATPTTAEPDALCNHELEQLQGLLEPASHPELLGRIGRYELEQLVGRGGMGLVFRGYDSQLQRVVAIKTLAVHLIPIRAARERFVREARACASLNHPHIVPVHDVLTEGPVPALVMQFVAGPTLEQWLRTKGALPWPQALRLALQLSDALAVAHQNDFVHRDIKPGNVLLEADGSRALLTDFGLVRALDEATVTRSGMLAGTPEFMSPEQARGEKVDVQSDLFSLGATLYSMLCGRPPFTAPEAMAVMNRICHERHDSLAQQVPEMPRAAVQLVDRLLAKDRRRRPPSAQAVAGELYDLLFAKPRAWYSAQSILSACQRWRWQVGLAALVSCLAIGGWAWFRYGPDGSRQDWRSEAEWGQPAPAESDLGSVSEYPRGFEPYATSGFPIVRSFDRQVAEVWQDIDRMVEEHQGSAEPRQSWVDAWAGSSDLDTGLQELQWQLQNLEQEIARER